MLPDIFDRVTHPYDPDAFERLLTSHNLAHAYPHLAHQLRNGFPLGLFPEIARTVIHKSPAFDPDCIIAINDYLLEEVSASRMSGPFSASDTECILRGPFICSPFTVAKQLQGPGLSNKIRVCRNLSKASRNFPSTNSFIEKDDFSTRIDTAF